MWIYLYKMGSRLYWMNKYSIDKDRMHDIYMDEVDRDDHIFILKYTRVIWRPRHIDNKSDYVEWEEDMDDVLSSFPSIKKKNRIDKIEKLLKSE